MAEALTRKAAPERPADAGDVTPRGREVHLPVYLVAASVVAGVQLWRLWFLTFRYFDLDELEHTHAAWLVSRGLLPYRDFFEHHTPGVYYLIAPFLPAFRVETDADQAIAFLLFARFLMWLIAAGVLILTFQLGRRWGGTLLGAVATLLLATTLIYVQKTTEIRPDVPALALWIMALRLLPATTPGSRDAPTTRSFASSGVCVGAAIMFTQKMLFVLPGVGLALLWSLAAANGRAHRARWADAVGAWTLGVLAPIALTLGYFFIRGGLDDFFRFNLAYNAAFPDALPPFRYGVQLLAQNPPLVVFGLAGLVVTARTASRADGGGSLDRVLLLGALSFIGGLTVIPAPYPQYYLLMLPLLALFAARGLLALWEWLRARRRNGWLFVRPAAFAALLVLLSIHPAAQMWTASRPWWGNARNRAEIRYVLEHTRPDQAVLGGWMAGPGVFRPHAFFYFFFSTPEMVDAVPLYARQRLLADLYSGAVAPELVFLDESLQRLSPGVAMFVREHYVPVPGHEYLWRRRTAS